MENVTVRTASLNDLPSLTEIQNHYIINTHITFDVRPFDPEQRRTWFNEHSDGRRYQLLVADDAKSGVLGYACTGHFRTKEAYDTTVEASVGSDRMPRAEALGSCYMRRCLRRSPTKMSIESLLASHNRTLPPTLCINASALILSGLLPRWDANLISTGTSCGWNGR